MLKSGIIVGAISFVYLFVTNVYMIPCTIVEVIVLGFAAGWLAAVFDKPQIANKAAVSGGVAGLIAAVLGVVGNIAGYLIRIFVIFTPGSLTDVITQVTGIEYTAVESNVYTILPLCCCVITDLIVMVGLGALGGYLWYQYRGKKSAALQPPSPLP